MPFGGLGNRMRVMNSGFHLSRALDTSVSIIWLQKAELNASLSSLFSNVGFSYRLVSGFRYALSLCFLKHIFIQKYPTFYRFFLRFFYDCILFDDELKMISQEKLIQKIGNSKHIFIATCYAFYPFDSFDNYLINNDLKEKVDAINLPENTIGVHIRRTDHVYIIQESSFENYIEKMKIEQHKNKDVCFYVATDDDSVKQELKTIFGQKIRTQNIELSRATEEGIFGAVVDIYALARCSKIICNTKSSFATTAQQLGSTKEIIEVR